MQPPPPPGSPVLPDILYPVPAVPGVNHRSESDLCKFFNNTISIIFYWLGGKNEYGFFTLEGDLTSGGSLSRTSYSFYLLPNVILIFLHVFIVFIGVKASIDPLIASYCTRVVQNKIILVMSYCRKASISLYSNPDT